MMRAFLPPISQTTFFRLSLALEGLPGLLPDPQPTWREPVKAMKSTFGVGDEVGADVRAHQGTKLSAPGDARLDQDLHERRR
jgi:hypothetical protein